MGKTQSGSADPCHCLVPTTLTLSSSGRGPLGGLSFVAKDLFAVAGHTSSFGHARWRSTHSPSTITAPAIHALLEAGADLVGMTKMDQLAYSLIGDVGEGDPPSNSTDSRLYCGGSSSGSAAAVAAGLAHFALGTDTAGSVRVPAAVCGLAGIRATHGSIPTEGILPLAPSFDVTGLFATNATTLIDALAVVAPDLSRRKPLVKLQIAADLFATADQETAHIGRDVAEQVAALTGTRLDETKFGAFAELDVGDLFARLQGREIWNEHATWVEANAGALAADVRRRLDRCKLLSEDSDDLKLTDVTRHQEFRRRFGEAVPPGTVVVLPVLPEHGPKRAWSAQKLVDFRTGCFRLTAPASLAGAPQAVWSVRGAAGRSVGIGLLAAPGDDHLLLALLALLSADAQR